MERFHWSSLVHSRVPLSLVSRISSSRYGEKNLLQKQEAASKIHFKVSGVIPLYDKTLRFAKREPSQVALFARTREPSPLPNQLC